MREEKWAHDKQVIDELAMVLDLDPTAILRKNRIVII
jgi:hypothetical protein